MRGEKGHPIYNWDDLAAAAADHDLHVLTGCHAGAVPKAAAGGDLGGAMRQASRLRELFGTRLHLELWHHRMPEDDPRNDLMWEVARGLSLPAVATNHVHYHDPKEPTSPRCWRPLVADAPSQSPTGSARQATSDT